MCLPPSYSWTRKGHERQYRVPTRWGNQGRVNLLGTLYFEEAEERLEYRLLESSCSTGEVVDYLDLLAEKAELEGKPVVVVNRGTTRGDELASYKLETGCSEFLTGLVEREQALVG